MLGTEEEWLADLVDLIYGVPNHVGMDRKRPAPSSALPKQSLKKCLGPALTHTPHMLRYSGVEIDWWRLHPMDQLAIIFSILVSRISRYVRHACPSKPMHMYSHAVRKRCVVEHVTGTCMYTALSTSTVRESTACRPIPGRRLPRRL